MRSTGIPLEFLDSLVAPARAFSGPQTHADEIWTGRPLVTFNEASPADVARAVERAREGQRQWAELPRETRWRSANRFARLVQHHREKIIRMVQVFCGSSRYDAFDQWADMINSPLQHASALPKVSRGQRNCGALPLVTTVWQHYMPMGVIGFFTLGDYGLSYGAADVFPAIVAGNGIVQFVPNQAYPAAEATRQLAIAAGVPAAMWQVIPSHSRQLGIDHIDLFDHITYFGNTARGVSLVQRAQDAGVGTTTFMSVKNPAIVFADADMETAVRSVAWQAFMNAGQSSVHTEKVYVADAVYDTFVSQLRSLIERRIVVGARYDHMVTMGSLYSQERFERTALHVSDAVACGAQVVTGGHTRSDLGP